MKNQYDLIVLGAGNAGLAAAGIARAADQSILVVEGRDVGGTCAIRGCVPKKVLVAAAEALDVVRRASVHHIRVGEVALDWASLIEREQGFVAGVPAEFAASLRKRGIDLLRGHARFVAENAIEVDGKRVTADKFVVATGSSPRKLVLPGIEDVITSDDLLQLASQPRSVVFIGAGVVALELGHVLTRAGSEVTMLEFGERPLMRNDPEQVAELERINDIIGIDIRTEARVHSIAREGDRFIVRYAQHGQDHQITTDVVVNGAGRVANLDLDLDKANIAFDGRTLNLSPGLRSTDNPRVYFAGDAVPGRPQLSPVATYEGRIVGHNLVNDDDEEPSYDAIPSAIYAVPSLATVGLTEAQARARGLDFDVKTNDMRSWRSARTYGEEAAWAKVLLDEDGRILGAHLVGHGAPETIHTFAAAIEHGWTREELRSRVYAYPTFHADLKHLV